MSAWLQKDGWFRESVERITEQESNVDLTPIILKLFEREITVFELVVET